MPVVRVDQCQAIASRVLSRLGTDEPVDALLLAKALHYRVLAYDADPLPKRCVKYDATTSHLTQQENIASQLAKDLLRRNKFPDYDSRWVTTLTRMLLIPWIEFRRVLLAGWHPDLLREHFPNAPLQLLCARITDYESAACTVFSADAETIVTRINSEWLPSHFQLPSRVERKLARDVRDNGLSQVVSGCYLAIAETDPRNTPGDSGFVTREKPDAILTVCSVAALALD